MATIRVHVLKHIEVLLGPDLLEPGKARLRTGDDVFVRDGNEFNVRNGRSGRCGGITRSGNREKNQSINRCQDVDEESFKTCSFHMISHCGKQRMRPIG